MRNDLDAVTRRAINYRRAADRTIVAAAVLRSSVALKANFNPNQPRVAAGRREGGQWTDTGGGGPPAGKPLPSTGAAASDWRTISTDRRSDGSVAAQRFINANGDAILAEYARASDGVDWDARYTIRGRDGETVTFQNSGLTQTVFDGQGRVLSQAIWRPDGPEPQAIVQPAFAPAGVPLIVEAAPAIEEGVLATGELAITLYAWLSGRNTPDKRAAIAFTSRDYLPAAGPNGLTLAYVGRIGPDEIEAACPKLAQVQKLTDAAAASTDRRSYSSAAVYGTTVHKKIKDAVEALGDPNLRSEVSILKSLAESVPLGERGNLYGRLGSIRIDVIEKAGKTACVYDIKTGVTGLMPARSQEIATAVRLNYPDATRIIVTEVRPSQ